MKREMPPKAKSPKTQVPWKVAKLSATGNKGPELGTFVALGPFSPLFPVGESFATFQDSAVTISETRFSETWASGGGARDLSGLVARPPPSPPGQRKSAPRAFFSAFRPFGRRAHTRNKGPELGTSVASGPFSPLFPVAQSFAAFQGSAVTISETRFLETRGPTNPLTPSNTDRSANVTRPRRAPAGQRTLAFWPRASPKLRVRLQAGASALTRAAAAAHTSERRFSPPRRTSVQRDRDAPSLPAVLLRRPVDPDCLSGRSRRPSATRAEALARRPPRSAALWVSGKHVSQKPPLLSFGVRRALRRRPHARHVRHEKTCPTLGSRDRVGLSSPPASRSPSGRRPADRRSVASPARATWLILPVAYACLKD